LELNFLKEYIHVSRRRPCCLAPSSSSLARPASLYTSLVHWQSSRRVQTTISIQMQTMPTFCVVSLSPVRRCVWTTVLHSVSPWL